MAELFFRSAGGGSTEHRLSTTGVQERSSTLVCVGEEEHILQEYMRGQYILHYAGDPRILGEGQYSVRECRGRGEVHSTLYRRS